jgi:hypothetical protein
LDRHREIAATAPGCAPTVVRVVVVVELDLADHGMNTGVGTGDDREPDVTGPAAVNEPVGATGRIGADLHATADHLGAVAAIVTDGDPGGS